MIGYLVRVSLILAQVVIFFVVTGLSAKAFWLFTGTTYSPGQAPSGPLPVVAVRSHAATTQYQLVRWGREVDEIRRQDPKVTFKVPEPKGQFTLPKQGDFEPTVEFTVLESTRNGQVIEVVWRDDDYEFTGRYFTDGTSLRPIYYNVFSAGAVLVGFIPGLFSAWLVGRVIRRRWPKHFYA